MSGKVWLFFRDDGRSYEGSTAHPIMEWEGAIDPNLYEANARVIVRLPGGSRRSHRGSIIGCKIWCIRNWTWHGPTKDGVGQYPGITSIARAEEDNE